MTARSIVRTLVTDRSGKRSVLRSMERHVADRQRLLDLLATWL
jgi:hypothetical protein